MPGRTLQAGVCEVPWIFFSYVLSASWGLCYIVVFGYDVAIDQKLKLKKLLYEIGLRDVA